MYTVSVYSLKNFMNTNFITEYLSVFIVLKQPSSALKKYVQNCNFFILHHKIIDIRLRNTLNHNGTLWDTAKSAIAAEHNNQKNLYVMSILIFPHGPMTTLSHCHRIGNYIRNCSNTTFWIKGTSLTMNTLLAFI